MAEHIAAKLLEWAEGDDRRVSAPGTSGTSAAAVRMRAYSLLPLEANCTCADSGAGFSRLGLAPHSRTAPWHPSEYSYGSHAGQTMAIRSLLCPPRALPPFGKHLLGS